jgi:hypothetical protein
MHALHFAVFSDAAPSGQDCEDTDESFNKMLILRKHVLFET